MTITVNTINVNTGHGVAISVAGIAQVCPGLITIACFVNYQLKCFVTDPSL